MRKVVFRAPAFVLLLVLLCALASAGTISSRQISFISTPTYALSYMMNSLTLVTLDPHENLGHTFWFASNLDSPVYDSSVQAVTDGARDFITIRSGSGVGYFTDQFPGVQGTDKLDFVGNHINRIGISEDGFREYYQDSVLWNKSDYTMMFDYTPIPEPSSLLAFLSGAVCIGGVAVRKLRR